MADATGHERRHRGGNHGGDDDPDQRGREDGGGEAFINVRREHVVGLHPRLVQVAVEDRRRQQEGHHDEGSRAR